MYSEFAVQHMTAKVELTRYIAAINNYINEGECCGRTHPVPCVQTLNVSAPVKVCD